MTLKHYALTTLASASLTLAADQPQAMPHSFTANLGLFSEYRFRGIDQTFGRPALQGGFDCSHASGFHAGNWNANLSSERPGLSGRPPGKGFLRWRQEPGRRLPSGYQPSNKIHHALKT
ncbi:TorF family putative porin [Azotobacter chroococcum]|uniref:Uncharacterized protein (TIGR02001 family) n=1 Tax=Azotobacter chroococcum TaxID=353 RepID=A0A4R1PYT1_9GAMM|nr:TorF family putative porin [Azotobacter chroococcum]TBV92557.1 hypothetical protein E0E53_18665 [Azotobacter chroococcum]TCL33135.1 uncharacterized protein (TIGR02001 family) [Azotobacter chroococcum]